MSALQAVHRLPFSVENLLGLRKEEQQQQSLREQDLPDLSGEDKLDKQILQKDDKYQRRRRRRILFTESQVDILKSVFAKQKYLSAEGRQKLAESLDLSPKQVKTWFQNYRYKCRRKTFDNGYTQSEELEMANNRSITAALTAPARMSIPHPEGSPAVFFTNPYYSLERSTSNSPLNTFYDRFHSLANFSYRFPSKYQHLPMYTN